mmetsp:Transcript_49132/g.115446  ORF Transcript_49132/g.115446 Transcript_49132/m.115446 type:complete len:202 (+) Transcript_49132:521-1126(+)
MARRGAAAGTDVTGTDASAAWGATGWNAEDTAVVACVACCRFAASRSRSAFSSRCVTACSFSCSFSFSSLLSMRRPSRSCNAHSLDLTTSSRSPALSLSCSSSRDSRHAASASASTALSLCRSFSFSFSFSLSCMRLFTSPAFFLAGPNSTLRTRAAKLSEHVVSCVSPSLGLTLTNINVFDSPPSESCRKNVSFEFRNGT